MDSARLIAYIISIGIPALAAYFIFALDLFATGKRRIIVVCLIWGAFGAFTLAFALNTAIQQYFGVKYDHLVTRIAPISEELLKALILLYFIQQPRFRYFVDGAIYGFAVGVGFAMSENIFYVATNLDSAALPLAISRVLSASLMHATASAVVGIAVGFSRRGGGILQRFDRVIMGLFFAILVHLIYNNVLFALESGTVLLASAFGIGLGGGLLIAIFINVGLQAEKLRFAETLGISTGVSRAERRAVQQLGSDAIANILDEMTLIFGKDKSKLIHDLLIKQANLGILNNNLQNPANERLRVAWDAEATKIRREINVIRNDLGAYTMTLLRSLLPDEDAIVWTDFSKKLAAYDPNHVHSFDLFMVASELADTVSPEQIEYISNRLKRISIFKNVESHELDNLSRAISLRQYSHGSLIFDRGDIGDEMFLIYRGYADIFTQDSRGNDVLLRTFQPGDVIGELALLDRQPRTARARANGPLKVMVLHKQHFSMFVQSRPRVIVAVLQYLADRVRYTTSAITGQAVQPALAGAGAEESESFQLTASPKQESTSPEPAGQMGVFGRLTRALDQLERK